MFTGIIKELGRVYNFYKAKEAYRLEIESKVAFKDVKIGDSISVNGVCLTVVDRRKNILSFDVVEETIRVSNLRSLKIKDLVNLEGSLKAGEPLGGHFVLGHIDCIGKIKDIERRSTSISVEIDLPKEFVNLVVEKGSIAIDGVSLTVSEVRDTRFKIYLIPHSLGATTLGLKKVSDELNLEFDIIGKYITRFSAGGAKVLTRTSKITEEFLQENGF